MDGRTHYKSRGYYLYAFTYRIGCGKTPFLQLREDRCVAMGDRMALQNRAQGNTGIFSEAGSIALLRDQASAPGFC
jgi:hypothetical protein